MAMGTVRFVWIWKIGGELDNWRMGFRAIVFPAI